MNKYLVLCVLVPTVLTAVVPPSESQEGRAFDVSKMIDDCKNTDFTSCLGVKAVTLLNRVGRMDIVNVFDGVSFVKQNNVADDDRAGRALTETELQNILPEDSTEKSSRLFDMFLESAVKFMQTHTLQMKLSEGSSADLQRALDEGRGKMKKLIGPIIVGVVAKVAALIPLVIGGLALLAKKALIVSKLAFIIAAILALQKVLGGGHGLGGWSSKGGSAGSGWTQGNSHSSSNGWSSSGGPYYRSFNDVEGSDIAYSAHAPAPAQS